MSINCQSCGNKLSLLQNFGTESKPLCYDCSKLTTLEHNLSSTKAINPNINNSEISLNLEKTISEWYYTIGNEKKGPFPAEFIISLYKNGDIFPETLVWKHGTENWISFSQSDLSKLASLIPPPLPPISNSNHNPISASKSIKNGVLWFVLFSVLFCAILIYLYNYDDPDSSSINIEATAQSLVQQYLKAPSTASFPETKIIDSKSSNDTTWNMLLVRTDAQNTFGAYIRSDFLVTFYNIKGDTISIYNKDNGVQRCSDPPTELEINLAKRYIGWY
jgi:hypothetical protein